MKNIMHTLMVLIFAAITIAAVCTNAESPDDIVILANTKVSISKISRDELKQIFLKKKTHWSGSNRIDCVNAPEGTALRDQFRKKMLGMSGMDEKIYWQNQKIRQQLQPPIEVSNTVRAVFQLSGAISYAYRKDVPKSAVKIILVEN